MLFGGSWSMVADEGLASANFLLAGPKLTRREIALESSANRNATAVVIVRGATRDVERFRQTAHVWRDLATSCANRWSARPVDCETVPAPMDPVLLAECVADSRHRRPSELLPSAASLLSAGGSSSANLCDITVKSRRELPEELSSASSSAISSPEKPPQRVPSGPNIGESRLVKRWLSALAAREMAGGDEAASSSLLDLSVLINNLPEEPSPVSVQERGSFEDDLEDALLEPPRPIR